MNELIHLFSVTALFYSPRSSSISLLPPLSLFPICSPLLASSVCLNFSHPPWPFRAGSWEVLLQGCRERYLGYRILDSYSSSAALANWYKSLLRFLTVPSLLYIYVLYFMLYALSTFFQAQYSWQDHAPSPQLIALVKSSKTKNLPLFLSVVLNLPNRPTDLLLF